MSARLLLLFLGWVLEGAVRPTWARGGLIVTDGTTATLIGTMATWGELLGCGPRQARRCVRLAEELGLVEQVRTRAPARRERAELAAAYRPTFKLLQWLTDRQAPPELLPPEVKKCPPSRSPPLPSEGGEDLPASADLPTGGQIDAPDQALRAESEAAEPAAPSPQESQPPTESTPEADEVGGGDPPPSAKPAKVLQLAARRPERPAEAVSDPPRPRPADPEPTASMRVVGPSLEEKLDAMNAHLEAGGRFADFAAGFFAPDPAETARREARRELIRRAEAAAAAAAADDDAGGAS